MKPITTAHLVRRLALDFLSILVWVFFAHTGYVNHNHGFTFFAALLVVLFFLIFARDVRWWKKTPDYSKMFRS